MTETTGLGPDARRQARPPARMIVRGVLQVAGSTTALVTLYYLLPLDRSSTSAAVT